MNTTFRKVHSNFRRSNKVEESHRGFIQNVSSGDGYLCGYAFKCFIIELFLQDDEEW